MFLPLPLAANPRRVYNLVGDERRALVVLPLAAKPHRLQSLLWVAKGLGRSGPVSQITPSTVLAMGGERPWSFWPCQPNHTVCSLCYGRRKALVVLPLSANPDRLQSRPCLQSLLWATKGPGRSAPGSQTTPSIVFAVGDDRHWSFCPWQPHQTLSTV